MKNVGSVIASFSSVSCNYHWSFSPFRITIKVAITHFVLRDLSVFILLLFPKGCAVDTFYLI